MGKWQWLFLKKSKLPAKNAGERLLSMHMKQKIASHICQYTRQGILKPLLGTKPFGNLVSGTLSSYLAEHEAKQQQKLSKGNSCKSQHKSHHHLVLEMIIAIERSSAPGPQITGHCRFTSTSVNKMTNRKRKEKPNLKV